MPDVRITRILNPLDPSARETILVPYDPARPALADYVSALDRAGKIVVLGSTGLVSRETVDSVLLDPAGDCIVIVPKVGFDPFSWAGIAYFAFSFIVSAGVGLYAQNQAKKLGAGFDASPTYGWNGPQTMSNVDVPVPVIYGENIVGGNIINQYVKKNGTVSTLYTLVALGEGPLTSIAGQTTDTASGGIAGSEIGGDLKIEGKTAGELSGLKVWVRMGNNTQTAIPGFEKLHFANADFESVGLKSPGLLENPEGDPPEYYDWHEYSTSADSDCSSITLKLHVGPLWYWNIKEGYAPATLRVKIQYRAHGDTEWTDATSFAKTAKLMSPKNYFHDVDFPTVGQWDVRICRATADVVGYSSGPGWSRRTSETKAWTRWVGVDENIDQALSYPNTAMLGFSVTASEQISGTVADVKTLVQGLPVWTGTPKPEDREYSTNPIWCIRDAITNPHYGLGRFFPNGYPHEAQAVIEAAYCDEEITVNGTTQKRYALNFVVDAAMSAYDCIAKMAACCNGLVYWSSTGVTVTIDRPDAPVFAFGEGNIRNFEAQYLGRAKQKNRIEVQFPNADLDYDRDIVQGVDEDSLASLDPDKTQTIFIPSCTDQWQAACLARLAIGREKYQRRAVAFETSAAACAVMPGQIAEVSHSIVAWGTTSGRVTDAGNTDGVGWLKVNRRVVVEAGVESKIRVQYGDTVARTEYSTGTVSTTAGSNIVTGVGTEWLVAGIESGDRIMIAGILGWFLILNVNTTTHELTLAENLPATVTNATYVMEGSYTLDLDPGTYAVGDTLTLTKPWRKTPAAYDLFWQRETTSAAMQFRLTALSRARAGSVKVEGIEYNPNAYSLDGVAITVPDASEFLDPRRTPGPVTNLAAWRWAQGGMSILVSWTNSADDDDFGRGIVANYEVWRSLDGGVTYAMIGTSPGDEYLMPNATAMQTVYFKVVPVSAMGNRGSWDVAPVAVVNMNDATFPPADVRGLELVGLGNSTTFSGPDINLTWRQVGWANRAVGAGTFAAGSESYQDATVAKHVIEVFDPATYNPSAPGRYKPIRTETRVMPQNWYYYQLAQNKADHGGTPAREMEFKVWAVDQYGNRSLRPATIRVSNPVPPVVTGLALTGYQYVVQGNPTDTTNPLIRNQTDLTWDVGNRADLVGWLVQVRTKSTLQASPYTVSYGPARDLTGTSTNFHRRDVQVGVPPAGAPTIENLQQFRVAAYDAFSTITQWGLPSTSDVLWCDWIDDPAGHWWE